METKTKKPLKCCYPNCFECPYVDCRYDGLEYSETLQQDRFDRELEIVEPEVLKRRKYQSVYFRTEKGKQARREAQKRYSQSEKGKERQKRYQQTERFKDAQKRYLQSDKGKECERRKTQKKIKSGKNAEHCRRYREEHKEELREKAKQRYASGVKPTKEKNAEYCKRYYEKHKEELRRKARERYRLKREAANE